MDRQTRNQILEAAIGLFADHGYAGVSMRALGKATGLSPAAIYHHFCGKQSLYLEAMRQAYQKQAGRLLAVLGDPAPPVKRFRRYVSELVTLMLEDSNFRRLYQRELLDADETRLELLVSQVFGDHFPQIRELMAAVRPDSDPTLTAISLVGMVLHHLEAPAITRYLPGANAREPTGETLSEHIVQLILESHRQ